MGLIEHSSSGSPRTLRAGSRPLQCSCLSSRNIWRLRRSLRRAVTDGNFDAGIKSASIAMGDKHAQENHLCEKRTQGATEVGPCLTDAAPKDRSQRTARVLTAMMPPGCGVNHRGVPGPVEAYAAP